MNYLVNTNPFKWNPSFHFIVHLLLRLIFHEL